MDDKTKEYFKELLKQEVETCLTGCVLIERIMEGNTKSETHQQLLSEVQEKLS